MATPAIPISFATRLLDVTARQGDDLGPALAAAGIDPAQLADPASRLTSEQLARFVQVGWEITDDELFGLGLAPVPRGTFQLLCFALIHAPDLGTAWRRMAGFLPALPSSSPVKMTFGDDRVRIEFDTRGMRTVDETTELVCDFGLLVIHRFTAWLIGQRIRPLAVELPHVGPDPVMAAAYTAMFGVPVDFARPVAAVEFDSALLDCPIVQDEESLTDYLRHSPRRLFAERDYDTGVSARVRKLLETGLHTDSESGSRGRFASAATIAARLSISEPHLRRLLRQEGTTINQLREEVLRDKAIAALMRGDSVEHISDRLGFSEPSAFRRAFKRWTGRPPGAYR